MDPRLSWLRSFVAVAEELHFRSAAERLHLSTSAVSRHIRLLEEAVRADLFRRTTRSVHLTDAGRRLYGEVRVPVETITRALGDLGGSPRGTVRVAYTGAASMEIIPRLTAMWGERNDVELQLMPTSSSAQLEGLLAGTIDVGIHWEGPRTDLFEVVTLVTEPMYIALPERHRRAGSHEVPLCELEHDEWLMAADSSDVVIRVGFVERCEREGFTPRIRSVATGNEAQLTLVGAGHGLCMVPAAVASVPRPGVAFARLRGEHASLVAVTRSPLSTRCRTVVDALRRAVPEGTDLGLADRRHPA